MTTDYKPNLPTGEAEATPAKKAAHRPVAPRDIYGICASRAKREGTNLEEMLWSVMKGLMLAGGAGNAKCAGIVFDRLIGPVERVGNATQVNVAVDARPSESVGPPVPPPVEFAKHLKKLAELAHADDVVITDEEAEAAELLS